MRKKRLVNVTFFLRADKEAITQQQNEDKMKNMN